MERRERKRKIEREKEKERETKYKVKKKRRKEEVARRARDPVAKSKGKRTSGANGTGERGCD